MNKNKIVLRALKCFSWCFGSILCSANIYATTAIEAYRSTDFDQAAILFKDQTHLLPLEEFYLGNMYLYGYGVLKSNALALQFFKNAAEKGLLSAQLLMAKIELVQNNHPEEALYWFKKAAKAGDASAALYCAGAYLFGVGVQKNPDAARGFYITAAQAGQPLAQQVLAENFLNSKDHGNHKMGMIWLEKAVLLREPAAELMLAEFYQKGDKVEKDLQKAQQLINDAVAQKYVPAYFKMGRFEQAQNHMHEAVTWYQKSAELGDVAAQLALAQLYNDPKNELYSVQKGFLWILKAAQAGNIEAQLALAKMYEKGQGVEASMTLAQEWAAKAQHPVAETVQDAERRMVQWLSHGKANRFMDTEYRLPGIFTEWTNANALKENISNQAPKMNSITRKDIYHPNFEFLEPNEIPISQYYNAMILAQEPVNKEVLTFPQYLIPMQKSSVKTDSKNLLHAQRFGYDYLNQAVAIQKNIEYAQVFKQLFNQAILGDSTAQFDVALMYQQGVGVEKSMDQAIKFYLMAAAQNDLPAEYHLGLIYLQGLDTPAEPQVGMDWLQDAAFKGNAYAQYTLARIYEHGYQNEKGAIVVPADHEQSIAMYELSATNDYGLAAYRLADILIREQPKDLNQTALESRNKMIKRLYQSSADAGVSEAKLPLAFYDATDADEIKQAQAFTDAQEAAKAGSSDAAFLLGLMYDRGIATEVSREQAVHWYEQANDNPMSAFILGTYAIENGGLTKNMTKAVDYLQFAAQKNFAPAEFNWAVMQQKQGQEFLAHLEKAVALGSSRAGLELADYYLIAGNSDQQRLIARDLYERFAQQGHANAQLKLGFLYEQGIGVKQDAQQALKWYTLAAQQEQSKAQYLLGRMYQLGAVGTSPDYVLAKQWYTSAKPHYAPAAVALGIINEMIENDYAQAMTEYQSAVEMGDPIAFYNLGLIYQNGKNQSVDLDKAKDLFIQAAKQGVTPAMLALGKVALEAHQSIEAEKWFTKAAQNGEIEAKYLLGVSAEQRGALEVAVKYYQDGIHVGDARSMLALARLYRTGQGVKQNPEQAADYYQQLAKQNYPEAQYQLAKFCIANVIKGCSLQQSKTWLEKAQQQGYPKAGQLLRFLTAQTQNSVSYIESIKL